MNTNWIKTAEEYDAACEEIEQLMDAQLEMPEGNRLENLITAVVVWEELETRKALLSQALKKGEESGRADYSLKELLSALDSETA